MIPLDPRLMIHDLVIMVIYNFQLPNAAQGLKYRGQRGTAFSHLQKTPTSISTLHCSCCSNTNVHSRYLTIVCVFQFLYLFLFQFQQISTIFQFLKLIQIINKSTNCFKYQIVYHSNSWARHQSCIFWQMIDLNDRISN